MGCRVIHRVAAVVPGEQRRDEAPSERAPGIAISSPRDPTRIQFFKRFLPPGLVTRGWMLPASAVGRIRAAEYRLARAPPSEAAKTQSAGHRSILRESRNVASPAVDVLQGQNCKAAL